MTPIPSVALTMKTQTESSAALDSPDVCTIVVLYDDDNTRAQAMRACDFLVNQFWQEVELDFHWWRSDFLADAELAGQASKAAAAADFLIVCLQQSRGVWPGLESWFESWLSERGELEGALVDLSTSSHPAQGDSQMEMFLREACRRGNFEYLKSVPGDEASYLNRNGFASNPKLQIDSILGEIRPPSHYGLNE